MVENAINRAEMYGRRVNNQLCLGSIVVAATGNDNANSVGFPARFDNVISVGAINPCGTKWEGAGTGCDTGAAWIKGSNYGQGLDVVCPGIDIWSTDNHGHWGYNPAPGTAGDYHCSFEYIQLIQI
jgi:subtilisin family serine protease